MCKLVLEAQLCCALLPQTLEETLKSWTFRLLLKRHKHMGRSQKALEGLGCFYYWDRGEGPTEICMLSASSHDAPSLQAALS